jgi:hypothetical protein
MFAETFDIQQVFSYIGANIWVAFMAESIYKHHENLVHIKLQNQPQTFRLSDFQTF